jgi:hypothetical protein
MAFVRVLISVVPGVVTVTGGIFGVVVAVLRLPIAG